MPALAPCKSLNTGPTNRPWPSGNSDNIAGSVWDRYEFQLIELIQSERCEEDPNQLDLFDPDDPNPF